MIKHIVMWKLADEAEGADKTTNAKKLKTLLESLIPKIDVIKSLEVGINIEPSEAAYDAVLVTEFKNQEDLDTYQNHPEHKAVAAFIGKVRTDRVVVDYNI